VSSGPLIAAAIACFGLTGALGAVVAPHRPKLLDVQAMRLRGRGTPLAVLFTRSGYWPALSAICAIVVAAAFATRTLSLFVVVLGAVQLLSQGAVDGVKAIFRRLRPDDWLFHQELGFSFPSGHATTAVVFFGGLLLFVWSTPLAPVWQTVATVPITIVIAGIPWSRMVLGAHFGTDVLGGMIFGAGWLCLMAVALNDLPPKLFG
jgi:membrane-associated phospholipid phosphatase